jgi:hypothetical protein
MKKFTAYSFFWRIIALVGILTGSVQSSFASRAGQDAPINGVSLHLPLIINNYSFIAGVVGQVVDALENTPIEGAQICMSGQHCVTTGADGRYEFRYPQSPANIILTATKDTYFSQQRSITYINGQQQTVDFALALLSQYSHVQFNVVLTWDEREYWSDLPINGYQNDLDAHLWIDMLDGFDDHHFEPFYNEGDCTTYPNACIENRVEEGFGPETVAIQQIQTGNAKHYYYGVFAYNYPRVPELGEAHPRVDIYSANPTPINLTFPTGENGNFWYVFVMNSTGIITPTNCVGLLDPTAPSVDFDDWKSLCGN